MQLTWKFRLHDTANSELSRQARAVNLTWNYCNDVQKQAVQRHRRWHSWKDLQKLTAGSSKELDIHSHTIQQVCQRYAHSREAKRKPWLQWRVSNPKSSKRSLGWVPFNKGHVVYRDGAFVFRGRSYRAWVSRELSEGQTFGAGSFNQDSKGRWYINLPVEVPEIKGVGTSAIGIDLGLTDFAGMSNGETIEAKRFYRDMEPALAVAQRAHHKKRVKAIHTKIANRRKDHLHKLSTRLVQQNAAIFVGNVSAAGLAKTNMAKSVLDAGWSSFRSMLDYKSHRAQVWFAEVNEAFSTQTCSQCGSIEGPKGVAGRGIREWTCACGALHHRDINAARNILATGLSSLAGGAYHG